jgi:hypothetical protein
MRINQNRLNSIGYNKSLEKRERKKRQRIIDQSKLEHKEYRVTLYQFLSVLKK